MTKRNRDCGIEVDTWRTGRPGGEDKQRVISSHFSCNPWNTKKVKWEKEQEMTENKQAGLLPPLAIITLPSVGHHRIFKC